MLCKLVLGEPDVLVLDEPTNHLDIASKEVLEEALLEYRGGLVVVSHDRYFLDRIVDKLLVLGVDTLGKRTMGHFEFVSGGRGAYTRYEAALRQRAEEMAETMSLGRSKTRATRGGREVVESSQTPVELRRFNKFSTEELEETIIALEEDIAHTQERFGEEKVCRKPSLLAQLKEGLASKRRELELLYRAYEQRQK